MAAASDSFLSGISQRVDSIPFTTLLWPHCLLVVSWFPHLKDRYVLSYWGGFLGALGGGLVSSLLLMDNVRAPIAFFASNQVGLIYTISWWLVNYSPYGIVRRVLYFLPIRIGAKASLNTLRAGLVTSRVELASKLYPGVIAAPLLLGTIAGSGGKFCVDLLQGATGELKAPSEFAQPGFAMRSGFTGALLYYLLVSVTGTLTSAEGKAAVILLYVLHGIVSDLAGAPLDFTYPVARLLHTAVNVPMPGQKGEPKQEQTGEHSGTAKLESKKKR